MAWGSFGIFSWGEEINRNPYIELSTDPDVEGDAPNEGLWEEVLPIPYFSRLRVSDYLLAISAILLIVASGTSVAFKWRVVTDAECDSALRAYSKYPVCKAFVSGCSRLPNTSVLAPLANAIEYDWVQFGDGSMPSIYKGSPTAEVEKAWNDLWDCELDIHLVISPLLTVAAAC